MVNFCRLSTLGCALAIMMCLAVARAYADPLPAPVAARLQDYKTPATGLSIFVQAVDSDTPLLAVAENEPRNPASVIKLITTFVALDQLGPGYRWATNAATDEPLKNGRIEGNLYITGSGDPYLVTERFWKFLFELRLAGLEHIGGDVILDTSAVQIPQEDPGAFDGRPSRPYNVPPDGLLLNFGVSDFWFIPDLDKQRVEIRTDPPNTELKITNEIKLTTGKCLRGAKQLKFEVISRAAGGHVRITGDYPKACATTSLARRVADATNHFRGVFTTMWQQMGGTIGGAVRAGRTPQTALWLHTYHSPPLVDVIRTTNKFSNNVMARQLLLTLGAKRFGKPGTPEKGTRVIEEWLTAAGLSFPELVIDNGAGLSRDTRITARHLGQFLLHAYRSPLVPEFIASLPLGAVDGTMRKRFKNEPPAGRIHIKTGTLDDVRALGGYMLMDDGNTYVVVTLHNYPGIHRGIGTEVQDELIRWLFAAGR